MSNVTHNTVHCNSPVIIHYIVTVNMQMKENNMNPLALGLKLLTLWACGHSGLWHSSLGTLGPPPGTKNEKLYKGTWENGKMGQFLWRNIKKCEYGTISMKEHAKNVKMGQFLQFLWWNMQKCENFYKGMCKSGTSLKSMVKRWQFFWNGTISMKEQVKRGWTDEKVAKFLTQ